MSVEFEVWLFSNIFYLEQFENGRVVYTNTVRGYASSYGEITRQSHFKLAVGCRMEQDSVSQIMYLVKHHDNGTITGTGRFNTSMAFYTSSNFYYQVCSRGEGVTVYTEDSYCKYLHMIFDFYTVRWLKFLMRWHSTRICMSKWTWEGATAAWSSFLTPVWPHPHPMISTPDLTTWSITGKMSMCLVSLLPNKQWKSGN